MEEDYEFDYDKGLEEFYKGLEEEDALAKLDYVSVETAYLLYKSNFPQNFNESKTYVPKAVKLPGDQFGGVGLVICGPTLYSAQKWINKKHHIHIQVSIDFSGKYYCCFYDTEKPMGTIINDTDMYDTPEEALEIGINTALKELINKNENK